MSGKGWRIFAAGLICWTAFASPWTAASAQSRTNRPDTLATLQGGVFGRQGTAVSPLPNAIVSVSRGSQYFTVTANSAGRYSIPGLQPGAWKVRVLHVGYGSVNVEVQLPRSGRVSLDVELKWEPVLLPPLMVRGLPVPSIHVEGEAGQAEMAEVALRALEGTPGMVEGGLAQVVRSLPGNDPSDPSDVLLMRGSATDLKLVLLDGAPVYTPFHMAGLVESFDPQALGGASLFLGGAPARFDGGLSYILDLKSRSPRRDRLRGSASLDFLTGKALLEGPLSPSTGFLVASRVLHNLGTPLLGQGSSPYGFGDFLARLEWEGQDGTGAYLTGFWNRESVTLDLLSSTANQAAQESDFGPGGFLDSPPPQNGAEWGNRALVFGLGTVLGATSAEVRAAISRYDAALPIGDTLPLFAQSRSDRTRLAADFSTPWGEGALRYGLSLDDQNSRYVALSLDPTSEPTFTRLNLDGTSAGGYLEAHRPLSRNLRMRGGVRVDHFQAATGFRISPRLAFTWMLTDAAALTLAAGRYHQYTSTATDDVERSLDPSNWGEALSGNAPRLSVGTASHLAVSLDQVLRPGLRLGLEAFVKEFTGVSDSPDQALNASGVDLRVAREGEGASGWLGYTLTWFWASDGLLASGTSPFSGRHLLSAGLTTSLTRRTGLRLKAGYGDGLPYTSVPVMGDLTQPGGPAANQNPEFLDVGDRVLNDGPELTVGPDEGFLRLEVEVYGLWSPSVSGHRMQLRPYVRVLNALNRRDALFYHFDPWRSDGPEPLADLPVLPLVGLEWRF